MSKRTEEKTRRNIYKSDDDFDDDDFDDDFDDEADAPLMKEVSQKSDDDSDNDSDDDFDDDFDDDDFDDDFDDELDDFPKTRTADVPRREKKAPVMSEKKTKQSENPLQSISRRMHKSASLFAELKEKVTASDFDEEEFDEDFDEEVEESLDEEPGETPVKSPDRKAKAGKGADKPEKTHKPDKSEEPDEPDEFDESDEFDEFDEWEDLDEVPAGKGKKNTRLSAGSKSRGSSRRMSTVLGGQDRHRKQIAIAGIACLIIIALVASAINVVRAVRARQAAIYAEEHKPAENAITLVTAPADDLVDKTKNLSGGVVYLTFDDGPSSDVTVEILDILKANNVKATFFICPYTEDKLPILQRMLAEGHCIGIHGNHEYDEIYASEDAFMSYYYEFHDKVKADLGYDAFCMRFPGGSSNTISRRYCEGVMTALTERMNQEGIMYVDWNVSSGDAQADGVPSDTILQNVKDELQTGKQNVILMHDTSAKQTTADALQAMIDYCKEQGFLFSEIKPTTPASHHPVNN